MVGSTEVALSQALILKAQRRLEHHRMLISKLGFDRTPTNHDASTTILPTLQNKVDELKRKHVDLIVLRSLQLPCRTMN